MKPDWKIEQHVIYCSIIYYIVYIRYSLWFWTRYISYAISAHLKLQYFLMYWRLDYSLVQNRPKTTKYPPATWSIRILKLWELLCENFLPFPTLSHLTHSGGWRYLTDTTQLSRVFSIYTKNALISCSLQCSVSTSCRETFIVLARHGVLNHYKNR